jgi:tRNA (cmo5U34)-methyltransferase
MAGPWDFDSDTYLAMVRSEIPTYDALQDRTAEATVDVVANTILDLGSGTGETASRVLAKHPTATLVGVDSSAEMLAHARQKIPAATFVEASLEDELPSGPFDLVVSAFAVHHLTGEGKADLFERVAHVLRPTGRFVLCDVIVPENDVAAPIPLEEGVDLPDTLQDQIRWLAAAGLHASVVFVEDDVAIVQAEPVHGAH